MLPSYLKINSLHYSFFFCTNFSQYKVEIRDKIDKQNFLSTVENQRPEKSTNLYTQKINQLDSFEKKKEKTI